MCILQTKSMLNTWMLKPSNCLCCSQPRRSAPSTRTQPLWDVHATRTRRSLHQTHLVLHHTSCQLTDHLPGCPGSDDEANTNRASRTQRLSTQKKGPALAQVRRQGLAHHRWIALKLFRSQLPKYLSANALTEPKVLFLRGNSNSAAFDAHSTCLARPSTKPATAVSTQDSGKARNSPPRGKEHFPALPVTGHKL